MFHRLFRHALAGVCLAWAAVGAQTATAATSPAPSSARSQWTAAWIAYPAAAPREAGVFLFRRAIELPAKPARFIVHVSADNRYRLLVNGQVASEGPARGDVMHWRYDTVDLAPFLHTGRNIVGAIVWNWGDERPLAQLSLRSGFLIQGDGPNEAALNSGPGWQVYRDRAYSFRHMGSQEANGYYAASPGEDVEAALHPWGWERDEGLSAGWVAASPITDQMAGGPSTLLRGTNAHGEAGFWQLVPRTIPPLEEHEQRFVRVARAEGVAPPASFPGGTQDVVIAPHSRATILLDQGTLTMGYPVVRASGGGGTSAILTYAEALVDAQDHKGNRDEVAGRTILGISDRIKFDGGSSRTFQSLWLRTWRYLQIDIVTADAPLTLHDVHSVFAAYPFEQRAAFASDQQWIGQVWDIDWRTLRLSAFETFWDCPYYEQLQYVGDARIEALISLYNAGDDRLMRNAIALFDSSRIPDGLTASRYPSAIPQYIPPFSLWWVAMVHDYWMHRDDPGFVRQFLPGIRGVIAWYEGHLDGTGLLGPMPWWNFLDWAGEWDRGVPPGAEHGHSAALSLQFVYALERAAQMEAALGDAAQARHDQALAARIAASVRSRAWDARRGLFADSLEEKSFSQHTNVLAVLTDTVDPAQQRALMRRVLSDKGLVRATYYFRFYVDEALHKAGLADLYLERLGPWREMIAQGLTTTPEAPEPRSDSHAWSAHPNYQLLATVLGIRPAAPGFHTVEIAPALGPLHEARGQVPHPLGTISVDLKRSGAAGLAAEVTLPAGLSGSFEWAGRSVALHPGAQHLSF